MVVVREVFLHEEVFRSQGVNERYWQQANGLREESLFVKLIMSDYNNIPPGLYKGQRSFQEGH